MPNPMNSTDSSFVSFSHSNPNIMNKEQLNQFKENYTNMVLDGMDMNSLVQFAFDNIMDNLKEWDEEDIKSEILECYDEEMLNDLLPVD